MSRLTNNTGLSLFAQVFLATDNYDHSEAGLSVTTLLKPVKQVILARRVPESMQVSDVSDAIASGVGSAIHDGFERAWKSPNLAQVLQRIGTPARVAEKVRVNPSANDVAAGGIIPVYTEQRASKIVQGVKVTGKFDFIGDGIVEDLKNTSAWKYMSGKDEDYIMQGSLYRWLNPEKVTKDFMNLTFNFTDWSRRESFTNPNYPPNRMLTKKLMLLSIAEADAFANLKVTQLIELADAPEHQMPVCSDKDLWRKADVWKYYKNPAKATEPGARSTKNFDNEREAQIKLFDDKNVGVVVKKPGEVVACKYCPAFIECRQAQRLIASGDLIM